MSKFVIPKMNLSRYSEKYISHTTLVKCVLKNKSEKMIFSHASRWISNLIIENSVKEWSTLLVTFFLFNCRDFQRVHISKWFPYFTDRKPQKVTFWEATCFCWNSRDHQRYIFDSNFPVVKGLAFGRKWMRLWKVNIRPYEEALVIVVCPFLAGQWFVNLCLAEKN